MCICASNNIYEVGHWKKKCPIKSVDKSFEKKNSGNEVAFCDTYDKGSTTNYKNIWIDDSGATDHMSSHIEWFTDYKKCDSDLFVQIANNYRLVIRGTGTILIEAKVNGEWHKTKLKNVQHVPELKQNLFSTASATSKGFQMVTSRDGCKLRQ